MLLPNNSKQINIFYHQQWQSTCETLKNEINFLVKAASSVKIELFSNIAISKTSTTKREAAK